MKRATLLRGDASDHGTLGALFAGSVSAPELRLHVMEPPWRGNRRNRSCIPCGEYRVRPHLSPRFGRCLIVDGAPDRSHILFHAGNLGGDVEPGLRTHTLGCLLPGERRGALAVGGRRQKAVLASRTAMRRLLAWAAGAPFALRIPDAAPAAGPGRPFLPRYFGERTQ